MIPPIAPFNDINVCGSINDWRMGHSCAAQTVPQNINTCIYKNEKKNMYLTEKGL